MFNSLKRNKTVTFNSERNTFTIFSSCINSPSTVDTDVIR